MSTAPVCGEQVAPEEVWRVVFLSPLWGWPFLIRLTHGLRRGLHSFAARRLGTSSQVYFSGDIEL
jgi:hypothetical protein